MRYGWGGVGGVSATCSRGGTASPRLSRRLDAWLGAIVARALRRLPAQSGSNPPAPEARQLAGLDPRRIIAAVAEFTGSRVRGCRVVVVPTSRDRSRPGCAAATPRRRSGNWRTGWACRVVCTAHPTSPPTRAATEGNAATFRRSGRILAASDRDRRRHSCGRRCPTPGRGF